MNKYLIILLLLTSTILARISEEERLSLRENYGHKLDWKFVSLDRILSHSCHCKQAFDVNNDMTLDGDDQIIFEELSREHYHYLNKILLGKTDFKWCNKNDCGGEYYTKESKKKKTKKPLPVKKNKIKIEKLPTKKIKEK